MWIFVSYDRPERCRHALQMMVERGMSSPGKLIVNGARHEEYAAIPLPKDWERVHLDRNHGLCGALNIALCAWPNEPWYGTPTDDDEVYFDGWDRALIDAAGPWCVAHANDGWQSGARLWSFCTYGGELLRAVGYWAPGGLWHYYFDDVWECITKSLGIQRFCRQVKTKHVHHYNKLVADDETYQSGRSKWGEDEARWKSWREREWPLIEAKLRGVIPGDQLSRPM